MNLKSNEIRYVTLKRLFDIFVSVAVITALSPLYLFLAAIIKTDGGPAIYRQWRVGYKGELFIMFKFRSMILGADKWGTWVTVESDPRITSVGKFIRRTKLDELPQLFNVLRGDMSLVGPRPEVPYYVGFWPKEDRKEILSVKPGITDYATLFYNNEQSFLSDAENVELTYLYEILPHKLQLYRQYVRERNFWLDFRITVATLFKIIGIRPGFLIPEP